MRLKYLISIIAVICLLSSQTCFGKAPSEVVGEAIQTAEQTADKLNIKSIIDLISGNLISFSKQTAAYFSFSLAVILISSVFSCIGNSFSGSERLFNIVFTTLTVFSCLSPLILCIDMVQRHLASLCTYLISFAPTMTALYAASGNTLTSAVNASMLPASVSIVQLVCVSFLLPCIKAACTLTSINALCKRADLSGFISFIKSFCLWFTGLAFTLFTGIMSLQTILQSGADNLALKGIKYGASRLIPIAGGMLSESMKTVITSMNYIKSVSGIAGIVFIIYTVIPPICAILISKTMFSILSAVSRSCSDNDVTAFTDGISSCLNLLSALIIGCSVSFIILLTVFIKTVVSL